jgi:hypothetical protein
MTFTVLLGNFKAGAECVTAGAGAVACVAEAGGAVVAAEPADAPDWQPPNNSAVTLAADANSRTLLNMETLPVP